MDTIKILLGATVALLFTAVVLSWNNMKRGVENAPPEELARVQRQLAELELENQRLATERELDKLRVATPVSPDRESVVTTQVKTDRMAELEARLAETEAKLAAEASAKEKAERDATVAEGEAGLIAQRDLESRDKELRRARQIKDALLIARIKEYVENEEVGSFAVIEIEMADNVQAGTVLGVRRNTGILGQVRVDEVNGSEAIANPVAGSFFDGNIDLKPGDELILPPPF